MKPLAPWPKLWPWVRTLVIVTFVVANGINGCPISPPTNADARAPGMTGTYSAWRETLSWIGIDRSISDIRQSYISFSRGYRAAHQAANAPFAKYFYYAQIYQRWGLFAQGIHAHYRLVVEGRPRGGEWEVLFRAADPEHRFLGDALAYRRLRGIWTPRSSGPRRPYPHLAEWIGNQVFEAFPEYVDARIRIERLPERYQEGKTIRSLHEIYLRRPGASP